MCVPSFCHGDNSLTETHEGGQKIESGQCADLCQALAVVCADLAARSSGEGTTEFAASRGTRE